MLIPFGKGIRAFQKKLQNVKGLPSPISQFAKNNLKNFLCLLFTDNCLRILEGFMSKLT